MRHDDQCAFKINQRFGERPAHVEIRWLVGSSSSSRFGRCQTISASTRRAFSPPEKRCVSSVTLSPETEAAEIVAQLLLQFLRRQTRHMLQRGFIRAQELQLVLGEVAELNAFGEADFTVQRFQFARQQLDQRRFPAPLRPSRPIREPGTVFSLMDSRMMRSP